MVEEHGNTKTNGINKEFEKEEEWKEIWRSIEWKAIVVK